MRKYYLNRYSMYTAVSEKIRLFYPFLCKIQLGKKIKSVSFQMAFSFKKIYKKSSDISLYAIFLCYLSKVETHQLKENVFFDCSLDYKYLQYIIVMYYKF